MTRVEAHTLESQMYMVRICVAVVYIFSHLIDDESMVPTGRTIIQFPQENIQ